MEGSRRTHKGMQSKNHDLRQPRSRGWPPTIPASSSGELLLHPPTSSSPPPPSSYRSPLPEVTPHYHTRRTSPRLSLIVFHPFLSPVSLVSRSIPPAPPPLRPAWAARLPLPPIRSHGRNNQTARKECFPSL